MSRFWRRRGDPSKKRPCAFFGLTADRHQLPFWRTTACGGAYVLAEAGACSTARRATTHWAAGTDFRRRYPDVLLDTEPIYVKDGRLYTSAGVTSILDLMVALVEEDFGSELALRVAQGLVMFLRRPTTQSQFNVPLTGLKTDDEKIRDVVSHIAKNPGSDLTVERLGGLASIEPPHLHARLCPRGIGMTPGKFVGVVQARARAPVLRTVDDARRRDCPRVRLQHHGRHAAGLRPKPGRDAARLPAAILLKAIAHHCIQHRGTGIARRVPRRAGPRPSVLATCHSANVQNARHRRNRAWRARRFFGPQEREAGTGRGFADEFAPLRHASGVSRQVTRTRLLASCWPPNRG